MELGFDCTVGNAFGDLSNGFWPLLDVVEDNEALQSGSLPDQAEVVAQTFGFTSVFMKKERLATAVNMRNRKD